MCTSVCIQYVVILYYGVVVMQIYAEYLQMLGIFVYTYVLIPILNSMYTQLSHLLIYTYKLKAYTSKKSTNHNGLDYKNSLVILLLSPLPKTLTAATVTINKFAGTLPITKYVSVVTILCTIPVVL